MRNVRAAAGGRHCLTADDGVLGAGARGGGFRLALSGPARSSSAKARASCYLVDRARNRRSPIPSPSPSAARNGAATRTVDGKYVEPAWSPPESVKRDHPELPDVIPGGSPHNPMGARAITLDRDEVAIHGTTCAMRASVGTAASYGCIRMFNEDVIDLYDRVSVGAPVVMIRCG